MISSPTSRPAISSTPITITTAIQAPEDEDPDPLVDAEPALDLTLVTNSVSAAAGSFW